MAKYRLFLAYYTLAATVSLFAWAIIWGPKPQSLLWPLLAIPIAIYFALTFTGHLESAPESGSKFPLLVLAALFVSLVGVLAYTASLPPKTDTSAALLSEIQSLRQEVAKLAPAPTGQDASTAAELRRIKSELGTLKSAPPSSPSSLLTDDNSQVGIVTIKDPKTQTVNVYQDKTLSGKVIAKMEQGKTYPFIDKNPSWYLILVSSQQGYVASSAVKEVAN
ncbi:hypothetical protein HY440_00030 [Candidatus Microgenomates bacterium]|nr:hypothetical protein [Candidatus Microgenomates bacterium]